MTIRVVTIDHSIHINNTYSKKFITFYYLTTPRKEGHWVSENSHAALRYTAWPTPEPNNRLGLENCLVVEAAGTWNDEFCEITLHRIMCEKEVKVTAGKRTIFNFNDATPLYRSDLPRERMCYQP